MVEEFSIRLATTDDMKDVFNLSNDDTVRQNSIHKEKINWENHVEWFQRRIQNIQEPFYIAETSDGNFVAQIRFQKEEKGYVISLSIDKKFRNKGYGCRIIEEASKKLNLFPIIAYVKPENIPSQKAFMKAGFNYDRDIIINNEKYCMYILK